MFFFYTLLHTIAIYLVRGGGPIKRHDITAAAKIAAAYVGTVIGAGFASGQELMQFFACYGVWGLLGVVISGWGFACLGGYVVNIGYDLGSTGYYQILYHVCGKRIGAVLDSCTVVFLFGGLCVMLAGTGAVAQDFWDLPYLAGVTAMAVMLLLTTARGVDCIATANLVIIPLLILTTLGIGIYSYRYHGRTEFLQSLRQIAQPVFSLHWFGSSMQYLSYNLVLGATMLAPLGRMTAKKNVRLAGSWSGGILLGALSLWITLLILTHYDQLASSEVPMLTLSDLQHPWNHLLYGGVLLGAMYTTAAASLYGTAEKLAHHLNLSLSTAIAYILPAALLFSQFGFSRLISILYPIFGFLSCWFTFRLIWLGSRNS